MKTFREVGVTKGHNITELSVKRRGYSRTIHDCKLRFEWNGTLRGCLAVEKARIDWVMNLGGGATLNYTSSMEWHASGYFPFQMWLSYIKQVYEKQDRPNTYF